MPSYIDFNFRDTYTIISCKSVVVYKQEGQKFSCYLPHFKTHFSSNSISDISIKAKELVSFFFLCFLAHMEEFMEGDEFDKMLEQLKILGFSENQTKTLYINSNINFNFDYNRDYIIDHFLWIDVPFKKW